MDRKRIWGRQYRTYGDNDIQRPRQADQSCATKFVERRGMTHPQADQYGSAY